MLPFLYGLHRFQINTRFIQCHKNSAGSRSCNQQFVAYANLGSFNQKLGDSDVRKVFDPFSHVNLTFRCRRSIIAGPFSQTLSEIVAVPETTVENGLQAFIPCCNLFISKGIFQIGFDSFFVAFHHCAHILRSTGTTFNLEHTHTCIQHLIHKMNSFQVFRRHDIFVINIQFHIRFLITNGIRTTTHLHTSTPVGRMVHLMQRKIAFTRNSHTERTMTEHFNTKLFATRTADMFFLYLPVNLRYLFQIQFTGQYHYISKPGIEFQRFCIGDIQLGGKMHLLPYPAGIVHHCNISRNHSRNSRFLSRIDNRMH